MKKKRQNGKNGKNGNSGTSKGRNKKTENKRFENKKSENNKTENNRSGKEKNINKKTGKGSIKNNIAESIIKLPPMLLSWAYFMAMSVGLPLYNTEGFGLLGDDKSNFFRWTSLYLGLPALVLVVAGRLIPVFAEKGNPGRSLRNAFKTAFKTVNALDIFVLLYGMSNILGYALSSYRDELLLGQNGWYMGLITQLFVVMAYFLVSRGYPWEFFCGGKIPVCIMLMVSAVTFVLGILNRFQVNPLGFEDYGSIYISTLGNINWFIGYLTLMLSLGCYIFLSSARKSASILLWIYMALGFAAGSAAGSAGIMLSIAGMAAGCVWLCLRGECSLYRLAMVGTALGTGCQFVRVIRILFPGRMNYSDDMIIRLLWGNGMLAFTLLCILAAQMFLKKNNANADAMNAGEMSNAPEVTEMDPCSEPEASAEKEHAVDDAANDGRREPADRIMYSALTVVLAFAGLFFATSFNSSLSAAFDKIGISPITDSFGNGRGFIWKHSVYMFSLFPFTMRLFGVGPDGYSEILYGGYSGVNEILVEYGSKVLTNAHCEPLTVLINSGFVGLFAYGGMLASALSSDALLIPVLAYLALHLISFSHVLALPYLFIILGLCRSMELNKKSLAFR